VARSPCEPPHNEYGGKMFRITEKVNRWFDLQQRLDIGKMMGDWVLIKKRVQNYKWYVKIARELLKRQKQQAEEKFIGEGWHCGLEFIPTWDYHPFHVEETERYLALCWVRHIYKGGENEKV